MSADNGIYILRSKDGYRVKHAQAIENLYWWHTCCDNPKVVDLDVEDIFYHDKCENCGAIDAYKQCEQRDELNPEMLKEYFGDCKVFSSEEEALNEATKIYTQIMLDDFCPIVEYGIQFICGWEDKEFPKGD